MLNVFTKLTAVLVTALVGLASPAFAQTGRSSLNGTSGGPIKYTQSMADNASFFLSEGPPTALPGAVITVDIPPGRVLDDWIVTFSGECRLFNSDENNDRVEVWILFDGSLIHPLGGSHQLAFCSDNNYSTHSVTTIREHVPAGSHTIQVFWQIVDEGVNNPLRAWLDDWALLLMVTE